MRLGAGIAPGTYGARRDARLAFAHEAEGRKAAGGCEGPGAATFIDTQKQNGEAYAL